MEAYRFIWCVMRGIALPYRTVLRHGCANRRCLNPDHLTPGDRRDNKHDDWEHAAYGTNFALELRE